MAAPTGMGVPEPAGGHSRHPQQPRCQRGGRCARWPSTQHLGFRPLQCPARTRRSLADLLAHQLRDCQYAIEAGDEIFAPRMKTLLLRAVVLARRRMELAESTRRSYQRRLDRDLNAIIGTGSCKSARKATAKTLRQEPKPLVHIPRPSRHTARQQRKRTGTAANSYIPQGDRWLSIELGADLFVAVRSVVGTAARHGTDAIKRLMQFSAAPRSSRAMRVTYTAAIIVTNGGNTTDSDGLLTGPGLGKTGVGTYTSSFRLLLQRNCSSPV